MFVFSSEECVIKQFSLPHQHINAYHYDPSLLFQFILSETLATLRFTKKLLDAEADEVAEPLRNLVGTLNDPYRLFSWAPENGTLAKLKAYCSYFAHSAEPYDNVLIPLVHTAEQSWLLSLVCLDDLRHYERTKGSGETAEKLKKSIKELALSLNRLAKQIAKLIEQFWNDENVIYFILRHRSEFDEVFGDKFVKGLLKKMYLGGVWGAASFLSKRFTKRGFEHLIATVETGIEELENQGG